MLITASQLKLYKGYDTKSIPYMCRYNTDHGTIEQTLSKRPNDYWEV